MRFEFSAGGVVFKNNKGHIEIALILDSYDKWTFPKGRIEKGEKPELAAIREVGEEIGIKDFEVVTLLEKIDYWFKEGNDLIHKYVYFYLMKAKDEAILKPQKEEVKDARWFAPEKAKENLGYKKDSATLLDKAIEHIEKLKISA